MAKFLDLFQTKAVGSPPIWFMRQAGRYLPEYLEIRKACPTFLDLCFSPNLVAEVTLQPLRRFDLDVAIIFSDILVIPYGLGQSVTFEKKKGPVLSSLVLSSFEEILSFDNFADRLSPIYEAIRLTKTYLPHSKPLLGFAGAPWTLALYMLEGSGGGEFWEAKRSAFQQEKKFSAFLNLLTYAISKHLIEQVKAGVDGVQLFDSWAGLCPATHFQQWILEPTQKIITALKEAFPHLPIIGFPKGIGAQLLEYGAQSGVSALSLDASVSLQWARNYFSSELVLQGNLDPLLLVVGGDPLKKAVDLIVGQMRERPYIFNLGHGILPQTPLKNVEDCIRWIRAQN